MASPHSDFFDSHTRKRVGKACDRCRLKKSKCDGSNPCSRCKVDNAICVFGERKKAHDKVYPKGYVEMLEQQQSQLVAGIREMYRRLATGESWPGSPLPDSSEGFPLTHDILERLDVLHMTGENPVKSEAFEDDFQAMQDRLLRDGAQYVRHRREGSTSSDSEPALSHIDSPHGTPSSGSLSSFSETYPTHTRKRSSVNAPRTSSQLSSNRKKRHFAGADIQTETEPMNLWQDPWIIQSPDVNNEAFEGTLFTNSYESPMNNMYDRLSINPLAAPALGTLSPAALSQNTWGYQDPDFDSFMRSGYHGAMA